MQSLHPLRAANSKPQAIECIHIFAKLRSLPTGIVEMAFLPLGADLAGHHDSWASKWAVILDGRLPDLHYWSLQYPLAASAGNAQRGSPRVPSVDAEALM